VFDELLDELVARVDGAQGAILLADDGEAVQWRPEQEGDQLRLRGAYITVALKNWRAAAERLNLGSVGPLVLSYDGALLVIEQIEREYFIVLELNAFANLGQALFWLPSTVANLRREFAD
jgi:predicted regulator of Ras-like GTPase activity (Roadblock/LC7/MglB family)